MQEDFTNIADIDLNELKLASKNNFDSSSSESFLTTVIERSATNRPITYLHVHCKTEWALVWQKTRAKAWTSSDKKGKKRKEVGEIKLSVKCHSSGSKKKKNTSLVKFNEDFYGIPGVSNKTAKATAWSKKPDIGPVKVSVSV